MDFVGLTFRIGIFKIQQVIPLKNLSSIYISNAPMLDIVLLYNLVKICEEKATP